ncbi:excinuclease ABC subunit A [Rubricoccus marinus]|uniref:UvrABC system protein A n=1 Tax=Rubricoccus marinus TaxID=716817 RepID=A0A259U4C3_9BACT|nr:excinuclease ABC subunit A [Rubricoccus marinus]
MGRDLVVKGARQHNLKGFDLTIPKKQLVVVTGPSGSGKSSLVFDTIYAEGQRRYVESLSAYARQFLDRMDKPDVEMITGLAPAIAIEQQNGTKNPRSTVATQTEVYDYLRLLYARIGTTFSPASGEVVTKDSPRSVADEVQAALESGTRFYLAFSVPQHKGAKKAQELAALLARGFARLVALPTETQAKKGAAPEVIDMLETPPEEVKTPLARLLVLVDRLVAKPGDESVTNRIADSVEQAFREGEERTVVITVPKEGRYERLDFSALFERDGLTFEEPTPQLFSFNSPLGACPTCQGFGRVPGLSPELIIPNPDLTLRQGALAPFRTEAWGKHQKELVRIARKEGIDLDLPYQLLPQAHKDLVWAGKGDYIGLTGFFRFLERKSYKMHYRIYAARFRGYTRCPECNGYRVRPAGLNVKIEGPKIGAAPEASGGTEWMHIGEACELTTADARLFFDGLVLSEHQKEVAGRVLEEVQKRLGYLVEVGLDYLSLDRLAMTLSGGETQRINLATSLGSSLVGSLYVLDEPTIGLHPRDNDRLIAILEGLRDIGNTVLVVEHDEQMMRRADQIVDIGPGSGVHGGNVIFQGTFEEALEDEGSLTGAYLSGRKSIPVPEQRREADDERQITVRGARSHNLKRLDVSFPLDMITVVTGVSGSGKSTLVHDTLYTGLARLKGSEASGVGSHDSIEGAALVDSVEMIDQSPIGKSPRSNPVTYVKAFDAIRDLLASTHQAKIRGYRAGTFSFNVPGGRCEVCQGDGVVQVEMQFLADLYLECEACHGKRFKQDVLEIRFQGKNIADMLDMTIDEAVDFFAGQKRIEKKLAVLQEVGLGYLTLGQPANTLSGGEAQRVKLAAHLGKRHFGHTLYVFDEPTTGLHFDDIAKLLRAFNALVEAGHSVILIEHNLDVIKAADWVIDIGPEGGRRGGFVVAEGTPEAVAKHDTSHTARFLRDIL